MAVTDRRVQKMNEILSYIKFIKMYAWVKAFSQDVHRTRSPHTRSAVATVTQPNTHHVSVSFQGSGTRSAGSLSSRDTSRASQWAWLPSLLSSPAWRHSLPTCC